MRYKKNMHLFVFLIFIFMSFFKYDVFNVSASVGEYIEGDFGYIVSNDEAKIIEYFGAGGEVTIPSTLGGYPVVFLGPTNGEDHALFSDNLTGIIIPETVKVIGVVTFSGCINLTNIEFSEGLNEIQWGAFYGCTGLENIIFPDSLISIGQVAFQNCSGLKSIYIPISTEYIGDYSFMSCSSLKDVTISESTILGKEVFKGCPYWEGETVIDTTETVTTSTDESTETTVNDLYSINTTKDTSVSYSTTYILPAVVFAIAVIAIALVVVILVRRKRKK